MSKRFSRAPQLAVHVPTMVDAAAKRPADSELQEAKRRKIAAAPWLAKLYDESFRELDLRRTSIGKTADLGEALVANTTLRSLIVERCGLAYEGGRALGDALAKGTSLTSLDLSLNDIGPDGGRAFGNALLANGTLTELIMAKCGCVASS